MPDGTIVNPDWDIPWSWVSLDSFDTSQFINVRVGGIVGTLVELRIGLFYQEDFDFETSPVGDGYNICAFCGNRIAETGEFCDYGLDSIS